MAKSGDFQVNNPLFFLQQNLTNGEYAKLSAKSFYSPEELKSARALLIEIVSYADASDDIAAQMSNYRSADKCEKFIADILLLFHHCSAKRYTVPHYVCSNIERIPNMSPGGLDVSHLMAEITSLKSAIARFDGRFEKIEHSVSDLCERSAPSCSATHVTKAGQPKAVKNTVTFKPRYDMSYHCSTNHDPNAASEVVIVSAPSTSSVHKCPEGNSGSDPQTSKSLEMPGAVIDSNAMKWTAFKKKSTVRKENAVIRGKANDTSLGAAVGRPPKRYHFKVCRLNHNITSDQVLNYLKDKGLNPLLCELLPNKSEYSYFRNAYIQVTESEKDKFCDPSIWPEKVEIVRYYLPRSSHGGKNGE